jgi:hypothetical protein
MIFGNIYEIKFDETGPIPSCIPETAPSILVSGVSIPDALARWENSRCTGYVPYRPSIVSVTQILEGVYF